VEIKERCLLIVASCGIILLVGWHLLTDERLSELFFSEEGAYNLQLISAKGSGSLNCGLE